MKRKWVILPMIASWFIFIALDSTIGLFRAGHLGKSKKPFKILYFIVNYIRAITIFAIAILNFILVAGFSGNKKKS